MKGPWLLMTTLLLVSFNCFPLFLHFLASLIKLTFWLRFFHRQKADRGHRGKDNRVLYCYLLTKSWLTLCDPMVISVHGSSVHEISQARILVWVAISFSRDLPNPGIEPVSPALAGRFFTTEPPGKPQQCPVPFQNHLPHWLLIDCAIRPSFLCVSLSHDPGRTLVSLQAEQCGSSCAGSAYPMWFLWY